MAGETQAEAGCTDCGRKGGCDARKGPMFAAISETLERLYPSHRWSERDEEAAFRGGVTPGQGAALAQTLAQRLKALTLFQPGTAEETCDYVYVLCLGRSPSLIELREGAVAWHAPEADVIDELYLRVALSSVARFAGVQQVAMRLTRTSEALVITESPRTGVFDPVLLRRFQTLVAVLAEMDIRNIDFGEIMQPPEGFDPGDYASRYGGQPTVANYLFYPQPCSAVTTTVLAPPATEETASLELGQ
ncbi:MAG TPA: hypothetical protein VFH73_25300 [Polyangia bacterium]|jgi:hypothetical protein|nr:hypothetical protein [Polyangia bacterium]